MQARQPVEAKYGINLLSINAPLPPPVSKNHIVAVLAPPESIE
jgi:hypothetical protein